MSRSDFDAIGILDTKPFLRDLRDPLALLFNYIFMVQNVAMRRHISATRNIDLIAVAQRGDHSAVDAGNQAIPPLNLHRFAHPRYLGLDLQQFMPLHILKEERLAEAQRLAINAKDTLVVLVFDEEIVSNSE